MNIAALDLRVMNRTRVDGISHHAKRINFWGGDQGKKTRQMGSKIGLPRENPEYLASTIRKEMSLFFCLKGEKSTFSFMYLKFQLNPLHLTGFLILEVLFWRLASGNLVWQKTVIIHFLILANVKCFPVFF